MGESSRRLGLLQDRYGKSLKVPEGIDRDEVEDLMGALLELRSQLRNLQWYGDVNRRGFIKITKKLDKKVSNVQAQHQYLESKVEIKPFVSQLGIEEKMKAINTWLSALGDANASLVSDDARSERSFHSIKRVSSKSILHLPAGLLDTVDQSIRNDDAAILSELLHEANDFEKGFESTDFQKLAVNLLQRAISCKSLKCIDLLLGQIKTLQEDDDINQRNCIHRLVMTIGRSKTGPPVLKADETAAVTTQAATLEPSFYLTPAASPVKSLPPFNQKLEQESSLLTRADEHVRLLEYFLDTLRPHQREALVAKDSYGRIPLHYAAQYGFVVVCQIVIHHMQVWNQFDVSKGIDAPEWQDGEGLAPLHLSVIGGHRHTTKTLLEAENWRGASDDKIATRHSISKSGAVLALATKANFVPIVKLLVEAGVDINYQDEQGETALHVAARFGNLQCAEALLQGSAHQKANTEIAENTFAWTPLFIACVDGHLNVVQLLIRAGAELERPDLSGWTPKEHAALRGHISIARELAAVTTAPDNSSSLSENGSENGSKQSNGSNSPPFGSSFSDRKSTTLQNGVQGRLPEPVKSFGHRYLTDQSLVLVSLGSMDMRKSPDAVTLEQIPLADAHATKLDTALSLVVSASGAVGESSTIDLPVQETISTEPIAFTTPDPQKVKLLFDIIPTYSGSNKEIVGRAVAMLSSVRPHVGNNRINLQGDVSVPIMAADTLEVIGTVNFNFLIITPFKHPNMSINEQSTYWKSLTSTMVIGHRGLGKNLASRKSLQLGENTIQSFIAAANLGANYVEFDVQLTKDHVPVIYHDFLVSETGIDAPVHTLTLEQFMHISDSKTRNSRQGSPEPNSNDSNNSVRGHSNRRTRSMSLNPQDSFAEDDMKERMKHTRDFKAKGFKSNSRGDFIQAPFTTLEEMFNKLPETVGFNVEMKYPMLHESEVQEMDTYAVEMNSFVDSILEKVYDNGKKRNIIFSSFNPDICLLLSFKQPSIPVLFLTDAGTADVADIRASSLQEAIRFASRWNLLGVVSAADPLVMCPRLVKVVKESGLVCVSYGAANNDNDKVQVRTQHSSNKLQFSVLGRMLIISLYSCKFAKASMLSSSTVFWLSVKDLLATSLHMALRLLLRLLRLWFPSYQSRMYLCNLCRFVQTSSIFAKIGLQFVSFQNFLLFFLLY
jgi:glycerophosphodiester phosphodiesterase